LPHTANIDVTKWVQSSLY